MQKTCSKCQEEKCQERDFYTSKSGFEAACKDCRNKIKYDQRLERRKRLGFTTKTLTTRESREFLKKGLKHCPGCVIVKPTDEFHRRKGKFAPHCKECCKTVSAERNSRPEAIEARRQDYLSSRSKRRCQKLQRNYGITLEQYDEKLIQQNRQCSICGLTPEENGKALAVDHDHDTGKIRDLLCNNCNVVVGFLNERIDLCDKVKDYISRHKE
jgi:hypothetical protein